MDSDFSGLKNNIHLLPIFIEINYILEYKCYPRSYNTLNISNNMFNANPLCHKISFLLYIISSGAKFNIFLPYHSFKTDQESDQMLEKFLATFLELFHTKRKKRLTEIQHL